MFKIFYNQYKLAFWLILSLLLASGTITNFINGSTLDVIVNGILCFISIGISLNILRKRKS